MAVRAIDPKETYIVTELFGCGEGHALKRFTHYESGEACFHFAHDRGASNHDVHLYWRLYLVPKHRGTKDDPYDTNSELYADLMLRDENVNRWGHFPLAPKGLVAGQEIGPA